MSHYRNYRRPNYHRNRTVRFQPVEGIFMLGFAFIILGSLSSILSGNYNEALFIVIRNTIIWGIILGVIVWLIKRIKVKFFNSEKPTDGTHSSNDSNTEPVQVEKRYSLKQGLLTPTEEIFMGVLERVVQDNYRIVPQVQLSRIMKPIDSSAHFTNYHDFNLIKAKSIDFVLYDKDLIHPYLAIELDDSSHERLDRIERDEFVNRVMEEVGLRIIHVPVSNSYDENELRNRIFNE
ncbi:MAG: DUF2726 domain-containing protein [Minisyncoccia bacterium]